MSTKTEPGSGIYKMVRVPEEEYRRLRDVQRLLLEKALDSVDWDLLSEKGPVTPPSLTAGDDDVISLTLGFVLGAGAAALAYLIARGIADHNASRARR